MLVPLAFRGRGTELPAAMLVVRKRCSPPLMTTDGTGRQSGRLLFITDRHTCRKFLVATGAEVSVVPPSGSEQFAPGSTTLCADNKTVIRTCGQRSLTQFWPVALFPLDIPASGRVPFHSGC